MAACTKKEFSKEVQENDRANRKPRVLAYSVEDLMPKKIMLAKPDKANLVAVFYKPSP